MMAKLGIDLGTANSTAAIVFDIDKKTPVIVEPTDGTLYGDLVFPSYVAFTRLGEVSAVGLPARERYHSGQSELVVRHFKRLIGRPYDYVSKRTDGGDRAFLEFKGRILRADDGFVLLRVGERNISITEIASHLLRRMVEDAQVLLKKRGEAVDRVTISLPASFDDLQRQATTAAAKMAGLECDVEVIEEPTASTIAKGLGEAQGNIMVVDIGAGTTDVIIGRVETTREGLRLVTSARRGDNELGGIDMDNLILEYIIREDDQSPKLRDLLPDLDMNERLRLMGKIEEAKISASQGLHAVVSTSLPTGRGGRKRLNVPLDETTLAGIVAPLVNGNLKGGDRPKGVRVVAEWALLQAAGGNPSAIPKVVNEIEHLILVGVPCRMECMHVMLKDLFKMREDLVRQIDDIDHRDSFFVEGVAKGAAMSASGVVDVRALVPWSVNVFSNAVGKRLVIAEGTPYKRGEGISRSVSIPVHAGSNQVWILSQQKHDKREWSMHSHLVNVPNDGDLQITLVWGEGGAEAGKARVEGCGLPNTIELPQTSDNASLGALLESDLNWYLRAAKDLKRLVGMALDTLERQVLPQVGNSLDAERIVDGWLYVSDSDLKRCEAIEPERDGTITEAEIDLALDKGYSGMREQLSINGDLMSDQAVQVLDRALSTLLTKPPTSTSELIREGKGLLELAESCTACSPFSW